MQPCIKRGLKIIAAPIAEEASDAPCDTGSEVDVLRREFPEQVDFDYVKYGWFVHEGDKAIDPKALIARAARLRRWIKERPEKEVVLVSHGFFNHFITGDVDENGEQTTPWWNEAELRTYTFVGPDSKANNAAYVGGDTTYDGEDSAMIAETEESLQRLQKERRQSSVKNVNRPSERRNSLSNYQKDKETN